MKNRTVWRLDWAAKGMNDLLADFKRMHVLYFNKFEFNGKQQISVFCVCECMFMLGLEFLGKKCQQWVETACSLKCDCLHSWRASLLRFSSVTLKAKQYRSLTRLAPKLLASTEPPRFHEWCSQEVTLLLKKPPHSTPQPTSHHKTMHCSLLPGL